MRYAVCLIMLAMAMPSLHGQPVRRALVFAGEHAGANHAMSARLLEAARDEGYVASPVSAEALCDVDGLTGSCELLVLADASTLPAASTRAIERYLRGGGDIVALRAPMWSSPLVSFDGAWTSVASWGRSHAGDMPGHVIFPFAEGEVKGWERSAFRPHLEERHETVPHGPARGQRALHVTITALDNWDTCGRAFSASPFPEGHTLTVFSAKGSPGTSQLSIEWQERDGSRWIAVVPLDREWRRYVLRPADFDFWQSVPLRRNTAFRPENAARVMFGLSHSHTGHSNEAQEYWVGPFGCERDDGQYDGLLVDSDMPRLDTLCPGYKFFDLGAGVTLDDGERSETVAGTVLSPHPRPSAGGYGKGRAWRWESLLHATSPAGGTGTPATLFFHAEGPYRGSVWASFGVQDPLWYKGDLFIQQFRRVLARMNDGAYLVDGGAQFYTYFEDQPVVLGARVAGTSHGAPGELTVIVRLEARTKASAEPRVLAEKRWQPELAPGLVQDLRAEVLPQLPEVEGEERYFAVAELYAGARRIDHAEHEVQCWRPSAEKHFIKTLPGAFRLDGQRWRPHGVNYMPSSGIGTEDGEYFEYWVGARAYDPVIIQRDLERVRDLGFNAVSIFMHRPSMASQNLLDLLRRIDELGLKANLSLRPGTPMDFPWDDMRDMISYYRLWDHDEVFAYDLAWEPMFRAEDQERTRGEWEAWVTERYGSIAHAEADWGVPIPRDAAGRVTHPPADYQTKEGPHRILMAAYRRFISTIVHARYAEARRLVRTLDPNHAVSFRMNIAGDPTSQWRPNIPYDFAALGAAVDVLEPEGYGRIGDWDDVRPGFFTQAYARWACPDLPMIWAEAGLHAWDVAAMEATDERLDAQAAFYERFYRMAVESGADGIFWWWYPGGYRVHEKSDYGVINPDGTDRPVSKVIRAWGPRLLNGPDPGPVTAWLTMKHGYYGNGLPGIYDGLQEAYWSAVEGGETPGLRTEGTGSTSADCPLVAVGGNPCNGHNPPLYLDGHLTYERTGSVIRLVAANTGEAAWMPKRPGAVRVIDMDGKVYATLSEPVFRYETVTLQVELASSAPVQFTLEAAGRVRFGSIVNVH